MTVLLSLFLHYILLIFQVVKIIGGGGGQNDMFAPPPCPRRIDASGTIHVWT